MWGCHTKAHDREPTHPVDKVSCHPGSSKWPWIGGQLGRARWLLPSLVSLFAKGWVKAIQPQERVKSSKSNHKDLVQGIHGKTTSVLVNGKQGEERNTNGSPGGKRPGLAVFGNFFGVNTHTRVYSKLQTWCHWTWSWEEAQYHNSHCTETTDTNNLKSTGNSKM